MNNFNFFNIGSNLRSMYVEVVFVGSFICNEDKRNKYYLPIAEHEFEDFFTIGIDNLKKYANDCGCYIEECTFVDLSLDIKRDLTNLF